MKYQTFRMLLLGVASAAVALGGFTIYKVVSDREDERRMVAMKALRDAQRERAAEARAAQEAQAAKVKAADAEKQAPPAAAAEKGGDRLRPVDKLLLEHLERGFAGDRLKDVFPRADYKVNVAKEGGGFRIKLDLNRDGRWDEKWTATTKGGVEVKRQVAPGDDERYTESYRLDGEAWRKK